MATVEDWWHSILEQFLGLLKAQCAIAVFPRPFHSFNGRSERLGESQSWAQGWQIGKGQLWDCWAHPPRALQFSRQIASGK